MNEIIQLLTRHGPLVVFVVAFLEQIGAPVPAIPVLVVAAALAATSGESIWILGILIVVGAMIADLVWFFLGRLYGYRILALLCRISLSPDSCVRKTESFYDRYGLAALAFSKFVPGFSLIAPPLAGALPRIRFGKFLIFDLAGAILWAAASIALGVVFHEQIELVLTELADHSRTAGIILVALLTLFVLFKWWERRRFYRALRMARITVEQLREKLSRENSVIILDVRSTIEQTMDPVRIPGAIPVAPEEIESKMLDIPMHQEIVLYCT